MNILHILAGPGSGGAEVYVKDLAKFLTSKGHTLHIAFLGRAKDLGRDVEYERVFLEDLRQAGVSIYFIGNESRKKPWIGIARITKYIAKHNIDICHTHLAYGIVFSALSKVPVVYTHHTIQARWGWSTYRVFNRIVDQYIGISEKCALALEKYTDRQVTTIFNAVSIDKFEGYTRERNIMPGEKISIAMVGRLAPQKNYENMVHALSILPNNILQKIHVSIAGEGSPTYKDKLDQLIRKKNLESSITLCGNQQNIPEFLFKADMFLMTSAWEGLPIALTEAAISGLPCIVTDVGGCSEVISISQNGVVVSANNPQKIAKEITKIAYSPSLIKEYSKNALKNSNEYIIDTAAIKHINLYKSLI